MTPLVVSVTPVFNRCETTLLFLSRMKVQNYLNLKSIIVDDGSTDNTAEEVKTRFPEVTMLQTSGSEWWAGATNQGVRAALEMGAAYILTINDDAEFPPGHINRLVKSAQANPGCIIGNQVNFSNEKTRVWGVGGFLSFRRLPFFHNHYGGMSEEKVDALGLPEFFEADLTCGNGALIPAEVFLTAGLYDNDSFPQYHADAELCLRSKKYGFRVLIDRYAIIYNDFLKTGGYSSIREMIFSNRSPLKFKAHFKIIRYYNGSFIKRLMIYLLLPFMYIEPAIKLLQKR